MELVTLKLSEIKPYEKNPRMNDGAVDAVAESIREYGFNVPIVVDKNHVIVTGHTRYKASQKLGLAEVPCMIADHLTDEQVKAYRIADNKVSDFSIWDNKLLLEELDDIGDLFTGFGMDLVHFDPNLLDESDTSFIDDNEIGVTYEAVFKSADRAKIEKMVERWDDGGITNAE